MLRLFNQSIHIRYIKSRTYSTLPSGSGYWPTDEIPDKRALEIKRNYQRVRVYLAKEIAEKIHEHEQIARSIHRLNETEQFGIEYPERRDLEEQFLKDLIASIESPDQVVKE